MPGAGENEARRDDSQKQRVYKSRREEHRLKCKDDIWTHTPRQETTGPTRGRVPSKVGDGQFCLLQEAAEKGTEELAT